MIGICSQQSMGLLAWIRNYKPFKTKLIMTSATARMPDVLEMLYRPHIIGASESQQKKYTYRLGGLTCLAWDVIGDYSFDQ